MLLWELLKPSGGGRPVMPGDAGVAGRDNHGRKLDRHAKGAIGIGFTGHAWAACSEGKRDVRSAAVGDGRGDVRFG